MQIRPPGDRPADPGQDRDPEAWSRAGIAALQNALAAQRLDQLDASIQVLRAAAEAIPPDHADHAGALSHLGVALWLRFERTGELAGLAAALEIHRRAVEVVPAARAAAVLTNYAITLKGHFWATGELASLDKAVQAHRQAAEVTPPDHPDHATYLANLADALVVHWDQTGDLGHLWEAVAVGRRAVEATPEADPARIRRLADFGDSLVLAFHETGDPEHLEEAVRVLRRSAALAAEGGPDWARAMDFLHGALSAGLERGGDLGSLDEAIDAGQRAVTATPAGAPARSGRLLKLARTWQSRYGHSHELADIDQAVQLGREALALAPLDDPGRDVYLTFLGTVIEERCRRRPDPTGLEEAVRLYEEGAERAPSERAAVALGNLSWALQERHERTGDMADIDRAVRVGRRALELAGHPPRTSNLLALGAALQAHYRRFGRRADLEEAVALGHQAVKLTGADPRRHATALSNLAGAVEEGYRRGGAGADLDELLRLRRAAVAATARDDERWPGRLDDLGRALYDRFEITGELAVINEAIALHQQAVTARPGDHPAVAGYLSNLGNAYSLRSDRTGQLADIDQAIRIHRRAVAAAVPGDRVSALVLSSLGAAIQARYRRSGALDELEEAIAIHRRVLAALPEGDAHRAGAYSNLGRMLRARYLQTGDVASLEEAVVAQRRAVAAIPEDHPLRALVLLNLATALRTSLERTWTDHLLVEALDAFEAVARHPTAAVNLRIAAGTQLGHLAVRAGDFVRAARGFGTAVELLARLAPRHLARRDAEHWLRRFSGLASEAAACALQVGDPTRAVSLLEMGRGVLLSQALESRSDLSDLHEHAPELAERYEALSVELDRLGDAGDTPTADGAERRRRLSSELEALIERIRAIPGWNRFLLPPTVEELAAAAARGPIVLVNVSAARGDALILTVRGVRVVPLPGLTRDAAVRRSNLFLHALGIALDQSSGALRRWRAEQLISEVLGWLWDAVTGPVLDELGLHEAPPAGGPLPRVWWAPVGLLAHLPLHAAGYHDGTPRRTVMDRVVSSYTPTVRALTYARSRRPHGSRPSRTLVVAMPETPGASDLPGAEREAELIRMRFPDAIVLRGGRATREEVLARLPTATRVHFACHGLSDPTDPSSSRLLLNDHNRSPMTLLAVSRLRLRDVELAYLSACETARVSPDLADEATHIASAFQLAGFPEVVGTFWTVDDTVAVRVAERIYSVDAAVGTAGRDGQVAIAVHTATRELRDQYPKSPSLWAAHMHAGA